MRHITISDERRSGRAAPPAPEPARVYGPYCPAAGNSGTAENDEIASLLPGGQTHGAEFGRIGSGFTSSPEPVIGYGATKGISGYYRAVLRFGYERILTH